MVDYLARKHDSSPEQARELMHSSTRLLQGFFAGSIRAGMSFSVKGYFFDHPLTVTKETAKEAFAKAIEWHVVERFTEISISDDRKSYSIAEFASVMSDQS